MDWLNCYNKILVKTKVIMREKENLTIVLFKSFGSIATFLYTCDQEVASVNYGNNGRPSGSAIASESC